jgi:hypothetical protein
LEFLQLDVHTVGNFHAQELFADFSHLSQDSTRRGDFIAGGHFRKHFPLVFRFLALRPDQQEVEHHQEQRRQRQ